LPNRSGELNLLSAPTSVEQSSGNSYDVSFSYLAFSPFD
jgi:hypothetical protein